MSHSVRRRILIVCMPGLLLFLFGCVAGMAGIRINTTASLPQGLWRISNQIKKGAYISACVRPSAPMMGVAIQRHYLPDGSCEGGYAPLLKRIVAVEGDTVTLTDEAVIVNGVALPNSASLTHKIIDPLPGIGRGDYLVGADEYWLIATDNPHSFDSRYFGAIHRADIRYGMTPLLTFAKP